MCRLPTILLSDNVTKQYKLVLVKGRWCPAARKVTIGLPLHWPWITDLSGLSIYWLNGLVRETSKPCLCSAWDLVSFIFFSAINITTLPCKMKNSIYPIHVILFPQNWMALQQVVVMLYGILNFRKAMSQNCWKWLSSALTHTSCLFHHRSITSSTLFSMSQQTAAATHLHPRH